ncbi:MAG: hypothetical protein HN961_08420, partial [Planctomycetes bacterium]|nr:hypothetical protein [Planctomycetota bacterium]
MTQVPSTSPLFAWLDVVAQRGASDLHLASGRVPRIRVSGELVELDAASLDAAASEQICLEIVPADRKADLDDTGTCDFAFEHGDDRYRASVFLQRGT